MTDREKLIELIGKVQDEGMDYSDVVCAYRTSNERLADYLLANGVHLESKQATSGNASDENKRWIPVTERLPKNGERVLVWFEYFRYGSYNRLFRTVGISYTFCGEWSGFVNGESGWRELKILAWMPLPEPPEKE